MEVAEPGSTPAAVEHGDAEGGADDAENAEALSGMKLKDIISGIKRRNGVKPMPSSVLRASERRKRRRRQSQGLPVEEAPAERTARILTPPPAEEPQAAEEQADEVVAPQVTLDEDGNIVIDQSSLVVSAGTATNAELERRDVTTVENHAYSSHITSATYAKRESSSRWEAAETDSFYAALRKFGTDFLLMESAFPKRSRRQLKLKFKREEKECPERIDEALNGPKSSVPPVEKAVADDEGQDKEAHIGSENREPVNSDIRVEPNREEEDAEQGGRTGAVVIEEVRHRGDADDEEETANGAAVAEKDDDSDRWTDSDDSDG